MITSIKKWTPKSSREILNHPRMKLREDEVVLPNGKVIPYLLQPYNGAGGVIVICRHADEILLQKEYSYPVDAVLWQLPGGKIESSESPNEAANRELPEESELRASKIVELGKFYADNRRTSAQPYVVLAENLNEHILAPDNSEIIESEWVKLTQSER